MTTKRRCGLFLFLIAPVLIVSHAGCCTNSYRTNCGDHKSLRAHLGALTSRVFGRKSKHQSDVLIQGEIIGVVAKPPRSKSWQHPRFHPVPVKYVSAESAAIDEPQHDDAPQHVFEFSPEMPQLQPIPEGQSEETAEAPEPMMLDFPDSLDALFGDPQEPPELPVDAKNAASDPLPRPTSAEGVTQTSFHITD